MGKSVYNVLMLGSPGSGKTMLARRLPTILPPLSAHESLETTRVYSAVGRMPAGEGLLATRPFRGPHHTISDAGMVGGGTIPTPGEITLAHHGVPCQAFSDSELSQAVFSRFHGRNGFSQIFSLAA